LLRLAFDAAGETGGDGVKILDNGNVQITVQLMPEAYAALMVAKERDKMSVVDLVNLALISYDSVSSLMEQAGLPMRDVP
jgi:hypothetical protein